MFRLIILLATSLICFTSPAWGETLFADYFDIETNSSAGAEVMGRIHLKSNRYSHKAADRQGYRFVLEGKAKERFAIETLIDARGRVTGQLRVAPGQRTGRSASNHPLQVSLRHQGRVLAEEDIVVHVVASILWQELWRHYQPVTLSVPRLYGRKKFIDEELLSLIEDIEANQGRMSFTDTYDKHPSAFSGNTIEKT